MILSDRTIRRLLAEKTLVIEPIEADQVQPASVDFRLGGNARLFMSHAVECIDPLTEQPELTQEYVIPEGRALVLHPGEFLLASSLERVGLPDDIVARVDGKSSLGRIGLQAHATAGFVDPGFNGNITLELSNVATLPIRLWPGMRIGQMSFMRMDVAAERPYGHPDLNSKYQDQAGPVPSRYSQNRR